tara:strand:+ start:753 stop:1034 length:282 start_codon:yes stop_codon:yes gene_type:complete
MIENVDYQMIPDVTDKDHWNIRILKGEFVETVFAFDKITFDEKDDKLKFTFNISFTPDPELDIHNNGLQLCAGKILYNLIESANDDKPRTDDT